MSTLYWVLFGPDIWVLVLWRVAMLAAGLGLGRLLFARSVRRDVLRSAAEARSSSATLSQRAIGALGVVVWAVDGDQVVRLSVGGALAKLGLVPGQLVGRRVDDIGERGRRTNDAEDQTDVIRRVFASGRLEVQTNAHAGAGGVTRYLRTEYAPLVDASGAVEYVCGVSVDVTDEETRARQTHDEAIAVAAMRMLPKGLRGETADLILRD